MKKIMMEGERRRVVTINEEPTRTQQQFKDDVDVNNIIRKYKKTGMWPAHMRTPNYGDFTKVTDYATALQQVIDAQSSFMQLPSQLRSKFSNDPQKLIEFLEDPRNDEEAIRLGLRVEKVKQGDAKNDKPKDDKSDAMKTEKNTQN